MTTPSKSPSKATPPKRMEPPKKPTLQHFDSDEEIVDWDAPVPANKRNKKKQ